jgi:hypothetical protein
MIELTEEIREGLNTALNEASLISVHVDRDTRTAWVTLSVLMLPEDDGPPPADPRVLLRLHPVGRVAASLRGGNWDDADAAVQHFEGTTFRWWWRVSAPNRSTVGSSSTTVKKNPRIG